MSVEFYNQNAQQFFSSTVEVDSTSLLDQFVPYLPQGGLVLDAGCGSGRDSKRFLDMGYQIDAFDASAPLAALAEELLNQSVTVTTFENFTSSKRYDGIWACASLLHVTRESLPETFAHLAKMLKCGGAFYCSFKYGQDEVERDQDLSKPLITRLKLKFQSHSFSHPVWIYCLILCLMLCKVVLR